MGRRALPVTEYRYGYVRFGDLKRHEGVGMKAQRWLQYNRNTKIGRIGCSQVFVNLNPQYNEL